MRQRTMLDLVSDLVRSFIERIAMKVFTTFAHPELCSTCPHYYLHTYNNNSNDHDNDYRHVRQDQ